MKKKKRRVLLVIILIIGIGILSYLYFSDYKKNKSKVVTKKSEVKEKTKEEENKDDILPTIELIGREEITLVKNSIYEEKGARATDNIDGDITDKIEIKGSVDTTNVNEYTIEYIIKDSSNNKASVKRKVNVIDVTEKNTSGIPVLMYHYFYDDTIGETGKDANYLAKSKFEEQVKYLKENDYYFPTMKEISMYLDGKLDLPKKSVVITIDDGEASSYSIAYPLAVKYKVPMVMFVVTSWTNPEDELQKSMIETGYITMQSHTHDMHQGGCAGQKHGALIQCIDHDKGVEDMKKSSEILGNSDSMAYPCGDYNDHAIEILKEASYSLGFTTEYGKVTRSSNRYYLPRVRINSGISLSYFIDSL